MNNFLSIFFIFVFALSSQAVEMGVPVQLKFKNPAGVYPDATGVLFSVQILSPSGGCVIYEEDFTNQTVTAGSVSLALGSGNPAGFNPTPALTVTQAYENLTAKNNLTCVDISNNPVSTGQVYNPGANDTRILRVRATISGSPIVADFIQRAAPYALHAQTVGGKVAADIIVQNGSTSLNQANLESIFSDGTKFTRLSNLANSGLADNATTATSAGSANYFTANLLGDVTGTQSATVVAAIRGVGVAATAPATGQVLAFNGSMYVPTTISVSSPVTSVNGQTGAVVLNASNIAGVVTSASALLGDVTGNVSATVVSTVGGKSAASITATVNDVYAATSLPLANSIAKRDSGGNITATSLFAGDLRVNQGVRFYEITNTNYVTLNAPAAFTNYTLTLPNSDGNSGEVLQTNGSGVLSWITPASVTSSSISAALGYTPADNSLVVTRSNNLSDLASATVARANLGLGQAATLNIGTTTGTVAAGDDARIVDALSQTSFNSYVASATCTTGQSMYWNSVSSLFACQDIILSGDVSGNASTAIVTRIQGVGTSFSSIANNNILQYDGTNIVNRAIPTCTAGQYLTFNGTAWSCAVDAGATAVASVSATAPLASTGGSTPTLSISQANGSTNGFLSSADWTTFNNKITSSTASIVAVLGYTPANSATVSANSLQRASNLSDLTNVATARTNLGLGGFATASSVDLGSASATGTLATGRLPSFSGDVTSTSGSNVLTLANSTVTPGTYTKFQVNAKGLITSGTNITSADVVSALGFTPSSSTAVTSVNVTAPLSSTGGSTPTLSMSQANGSTNGFLTSADWTTFNNKITSSTASIVAVLGYVPASATASASFLQRTNNLSDLTNAATARTNLGLGGFAIASSLDLGSASATGTLAAARLPSFSGDVTSTSGSNVLTLANSTVTPGTYTKFQVNAKGLITSGTNITSADVVSALGFTPANNAASGTYLLKASNLSDLASATVARANLGLGQAATLNIGTTVGTVAAGDDARIVDALSQTSFNSYVASASCTIGQSMYWNSVSSLFACQDIILSGDISGNASTTTVTKVQGVGVSFAAIANNNILQYDGTNIVNRAIPTCTAGQYLTFNGTAWSCAVDAGATAVASVSATAPLASTGGSTPTISISQANGSTNGFLTSADWTTFNNKITSSTASIVAVLGYTPANSATVSANSLQRTNNLSDLTNVATARTNLGLGGFATASSLDLGSASATGTLAAARLPSFSGDVTSTSGSNVLTLVNSTVTPGTYTKFQVNAKGLITSGTNITSADIVAVLGYTPANSATVSANSLQRASNLSDLTNVATARTNLGLGGFATASSVDLGSASATGTLAAARLPSFSGDVTSTSGSNVLTLSNSTVTPGTYTKFQVNAKGLITSGTNITSADVVSALGFTPANSATVSANLLQRASNLSDLASATAARTNLGLGQAATLNIGTTAGTVAAGDDARIAAALTQTSFNTYVAGATCTTGQSMYWNSVSSLFDCQNIILSGDVSGNASTTTVTRIRGVGVSFTAIANNHILQYNGTNFVNRAMPTCAANQYLTFNGTAWSCATDSGSAGVVTNVSSANSYITVATSSTTPVLTLNVGTIANTVAAGNDTRITNALQTTTGFSGDVSGTFNSITLNNSGVAAATYAKVTVNAKGLVTSGTPLVATDIPVLDAAKITTGQLPVALGGTGASTSVTALSNLGAARRGANDDITSFVNNLIFSAAGTGLTVSNNAAVNGNLSVSGTTALVGNVTASGDVNVTGVVNGIARNVAFQNAPTTAGTTTAYTVSYGTAVDAKITTNTLGDSVRFRVNATNTGAATLKVAGAPAANLFSRFTGAAVGSGDLQAGYYQAHFDGTNWLVDIPPRRVALTGLNITADAVQAVAAAGVRPGDSVGCSLTLAAGTLNGANNWTTAIVPVTDSITVILYETGNSGNVTAITCNIQK